MTAAQFASLLVMPVGALLIAAFFFWYDGWERRRNRAQSERPGLRAPGE